GVADPLPIALTFLGTELKHLTRLDTILTVIDAETFTSEHFQSEAALSQVEYGDIVLLNKTDLVPEEQVEELEEYLRKKKSKARILRSQYGEVPLPLILDVELAPTSTYQQLENEDEIHEHEHHEHHHHHSDHLANDGFISISFQSDRRFDLDKFTHFLDKVMPNDVFRAKGVLSFASQDMRFIFQLSGKRYELSYDHRQKPTGNQLVLIGRNLDGILLQQQLQECLV
ncbi:MAG: GTP-binding protein, partial [Pseudanabaena sp. M051S1SP1A06QC]|nr:GTP-binding protein [Pseudanabaena sp. M051S1SP1A06QC]